MDNGTIVEFNGLSYTIVGRDEKGFILIQCNYYGTLRHIHPDNLAELTKQARTMPSNCQGFEAVA